MRKRVPSARKPEFRAERWILEEDARSAVVRVSPGVRIADLVGLAIRIDGCDYRCTAAERLPPSATAGRVRLFVESF
jgi:hypothetical protein